MNAYVLDQRHSEVGGFCDAHKSYISGKRAVSKLIVHIDGGASVTVRLCRPCARALAKNARLVGSP